jgi:acyl-CoA thioester hydrolase
MAARRNNPQLPPTSSIEIDHNLRATTEKWFEYLVSAYPHHTDYGGVVWHGNYLLWMEEARVEYLRGIGIDYSDLVGLGCELVVVEVNLRYHQSMQMGEQAIVKVKMDEIQGVRIYWHYQIESFPDRRILVSGRVTLVAIDQENRKIMRSLPQVLKNALVKL